MHKMRSFQKALPRPLYFPKYFQKNIYQAQGCTNQFYIGEMVSFILHIIERPGLRTMIFCGRHTPEIEKGRRQNCYPPPCAKNHFSLLATQMRQLNLDPKRNLGKSIYPRGLEKALGVRPPSANILSGGRRMQTTHLEILDLKSPALRVCGMGFLNMRSWSMVAIQ